MENKVNVGDMAFGGMTVREFSNRLLSCAAFLTDFCRAAKDGRLENDDVDKVVIVIGIPMMVFGMDAERFGMLLESRKAEHEKRDDLIRGFGIGLEEE